MNKKRNSENHKTLLTKNFSKFAPKSISLKCPRLGGVIINSAFTVSNTVQSGGIKNKNFRKVSDNESLTVDESDEQIDFMEIFN